MMYSTVFKVLVSALRDLAKLIALFSIIFLFGLDWKLIVSQGFAENWGLIFFLFVFVVCGLLYVGPVFVARFATRLRFKRLEQSFLEKRVAASKKGAAVLPIENSKIDAKAIRSMEYALFLRPFEWDQKLRNKFAVVPETRALAACLRKHKHGHAIFQYLLRTRPNLTPFSIYEEARTGADLRTLVRDEWELPYGFQLAVGNLSYNHDVNVKIGIEELLCLFLLDTIPLIGLGESSFGNTNLGLCFNYSSVEHWQNDIALLLENATLVLFIPWDSPGTIWELDYLLNYSTLQKKTLLLIPNFTNLEYLGTTSFTEDQINVGVDRTQKLLLQRGLKVEENSFSLESGGAFTVTSRDGHIYCKSLFQFGHSDLIFDEAQKWIESIISARQASR